MSGSLYLAGLAAERWSVDVAIFGNSQIKIEESRAAMIGDAGNRIEGNDEDDFLMLQRAD